MSAVFRRADQEPIEVSCSWSLAQQIADADAWISSSINAASVHGSTLDIGFSSRLNGTSVAVQGETIPLSFMRKLVEAEITLWLSLYSTVSESA